MAVIRMCKCGHATNGSAFTYIIKCCCARFVCCQPQWGCTGFDGIRVVAGCMSSCSEGSRKKAVGINVVVENTTYSLAA